MSVLVSFPPSISINLNYVNIGNRCRTAVNVFSQAIAATVIAREVRRDLERSEEALEQHRWEHVTNVGITKRELGND